MNKKLQQKLTTLAVQHMTSSDPAHDAEHTLRVLENAQLICKSEKADEDVVVAAALFHDVITYPKNDPRSPLAQARSGRLAKKILKSIPEFPQHKIPAVVEAIEVCSFSKGLTPPTIEAKILQDADMLESTGAIAIMRTYAATGLMNRPLYHPKDPFAQNRKLDAKAYALDLFYERLLVVVDRMHTKTAIKIARQRTKFVQSFLDEVKNELSTV